MQEVVCNVSSCFLCSFCIPAWKEAIALHKKTYQFKKGEEIFREGDPVKGIFFIYTGSVKVYKQWGEQKQLILRFAKEGDILGHRGLGGVVEYPIGATALEDTSACFITNDFLEATLKTNHELSYKLMHFYATELQKAEKRMRDLAHMEVKGRVAEALMELVNVFGIDKHEHIAATITRQDIASYAGTTYETVFKFFHELAEENIITTNGKSIKINDRSRLQQFCNSRSL
jgi:CRP/FNR family transcriptional regulator